jgi:hypothetical protein
LISRTKLEEHEIASSTWQKVSEHLENRLEILRLKNESSLPQEQTEKLRGRIAEIKRLLSITIGDIPIEDEI